MNILNFHQMDRPRVASEYIDLFITQAEIDQVLASETKAIRWDDGNGNITILRVFPDAESAQKAMEERRESMTKQLSEKGHEVSEEIQPKAPPAIYVPGRHFKRRPS